LDSEKDTYRDDGSTASTAVLVGDHLYVANVGDSRTVISKGGKGISDAMSYIFHSTIGNCFLDKNFNEFRDYFLFGLLE
jgi:serine/threonine protein phosphatase PrpC